MLNVLLAVEAVMEVVATEKNQNLQPSLVAPNDKSGGRKLAIKRRTQIILMTRLIIAQILQV